jgi:hypothetical protein
MNILLVLRDLRYLVSRSHQIGQYLPRKSTLCAVYDQTIQSPEPPHQLFIAPSLHSQVEIEGGGRCDKVVICKKKEPAGRDNNFRQILISFCLGKEFC